jgi:hypothetical protein
MVIASPQEEGDCWQDMPVAMTVKHSINAHIPDRILVTLFIFSILLSPNSQKVK